MIREGKKEKMKDKNKKWGGNRSYGGLDVFTLERCD